LVVRNGEERSGLQVRSLLTGELHQQREYGQPPALACAGTDQLLLADTDLVLLRLPALDPVWRAPLGAQQPIRALAVLEHFFALAGAGSTEVVLIPRAISKSAQ
jgi:hypothetical protein